MSGEAGDTYIHFKVEQICHAGLELILAALACGAGAIAVACGPQTTAGIRKAVEWQVRMAGAALRGLCMPADAVRIHRDGDIESVRPALPALPPSRDALAAPDRRTSVRLAVQYLYEQSGAKQPVLPMPEGTPFGAVAVDPARCTLCMACAVSCAAGALTAGGDTPRLTFIESRCHQCGLCRDACPEQAITLAPRILCDPRAVETPAVLRQAEPFACVVCGAPFATEAMVSRMMEKLAGHWMYTNEQQRRRLQMCSVCRTRDAFQSEDRKTWMR